MLFGNYLNILKLVFIWINLNLKLVLKKLILNQFYFIPNFFTFILYLLTTCQLFSAVVHHCSSPWSTIIHRRLFANYHRRPCPPPFAAIGRHRLPASIAAYPHPPSSPATIIHQRRSPPFVVAASHHHPSPSLPTTTIGRQHPTMATSVRR